MTRDVGLQHHDAPESGQHMRVSSRVSGSEVLGAETPDSLGSSSASKTSRNENAEPARFQIRARASEPYARTNLYAAIWRRLLPSVFSRWFYTPVRQVRAVVNAITCSSHKRDAVLAAATAGSRRRIARQIVRRPFRAV